MSVPMKAVVDTQTGEVVEIPLTEEELAQFEADRIAAEEREAEFQAELAARAAVRASAEAKLIALGLTPEEIATL